MHYCIYQVRHFSKNKKGNIMSDNTFEMMSFYMEVIPSDGEVTSERMADMVSELEDYELVKDTDFTVTEIDKDGYNIQALNKNADQCIAEALGVY